MENLISEFKEKLLHIGVFTNPRTVSEIKDTIKPMNMFFDISELKSNEYTSMVCDDFETKTKTHTSYESALKHVLSTIFKKIKLKINKK